MLRIIGFLIVVSMVSVSCNDDNQREEDEMLITNYIDENGLDAQSTASGLYYVIDVPGTNERPDISNRVFVKYTGTFLDGRQFDSSNGNTIDFPLNGVIQGWQEGIPLFGKGGKGTLILPSHLAYGPTGQGSIPPNTVLVFDVELVNFN